MAKTKNDISTITLEQKAELNVKINMIKSLTVDIHGLTNGLQNLSSSEITAISSIVSILDKAGSNKKSTTSTATSTSKTKKSSTKGTSVKDFYNVSDIVDLTTIIPGKTAADLDSSSSATDIEDTKEVKSVDLTEKTSTKKTTAKKPAAKKSTAKKPAAKKTDDKKVDDKKTAEKKPAAKKTTAKKTTAPKSTAKKSTAKKSTAKKPASKKTTTKKSS